MPRDRLRERIPALLASLRAEMNDPFNRAVLAAAHSGYLYNAHLSGADVRAVTADDVVEHTVAMVEAHADALVETTAEDLVHMVDALVDAEDRALVLADADLIARWPWSLRTEAGAVLGAWRGNGMGANAPADVKPADVVAWMLPALKTRAHPVACRHLETMARGFTHPDGEQHPPTLIATILTHPTTGDAWAWMPDALVALYEADPRNVARRCVEAMKRLDTRTTEDAHLSVARAALGEMNEAGESLGRMAGVLADELRQRMRDACELLNVDDALAALRNPDAHALFPWDEAAASFYEAQGTTHAQGTLTATAVREAARERWAKRAELFRLWSPQSGAPRFVNTLAKVLWVDVVKPQMERERRKPAALVRVVHAELMDLMRPGSSLKDGHLVDKDGQQGLLFERLSSLNVPAVEMAAIPKLLKRGVELFGTVQAHRVVHHLVTEGHRRVMAGEADARRLQYTGGWQRLAEVAGINHQEDVRPVVMAFAHVPFVGPGSEQGNLLSYTLRPHAPGRASHLSIVLGDMLLPGFVHSITGKTRSTSEARQLVPLADMGGYVGRSNEHGQQETLRLMVMGEFRFRAVELAKTGSVRITDAMWADMAERAGVPASTLPRVLDRWTQDGKDRAAFLVRAERDRWTLAGRTPTDAAALAFMVEAGKTSQTASVQGKASRRAPGARRRKPMNPAT